MRKYLFLLPVCIYSLFTNAQNVGIGTPNPQNKLHVGGGFRLDTLTGVGGSGLVRHDANGVVYGIKFSGNTSDVLRGDGTFGSGGTGSVGWLLTGNSGTNPATHFLGTTDDQPLLFRVNNIRHGYLGRSIFLGGNAGLANTANGNIGIGSGSLEKNVIGTGLVAIGDSTLYNNTAVSNTGVGYRTLYANTTGHSNTALGNQALSSNNGIANTALGNWALLSNTTGTRNTAVGNEALSRNVLGNDNTAVGYNALFQNIGAGNSQEPIPFRGVENTAVGSSALYANVTGSGNSAFGANALSLGNGSQSSAFGAFALEKNASLNSNAFGYNVLRNNTTGGSNSGFGTHALFTNTTGYENTAIGNLSLYNNNSYYNSALGAHSLYKNTGGHDNTALGYSAMYSNETASFNTSVGAFSLLNNINGESNTAVGYKALEQNIVGSGNTGIGYGALQANKSIFNTAIGYFALNNNTTGFTNTAIGYRADVIHPGLFNATAIGASATVGADNSLVLGSPGTKVGIGVSVPVSSLHVRGSAKIFAGGANHTGNFWNGTSNLSGVEVISSGNDAYIGIQRASGAGLHISKPFGSIGDMVAFFNSSVLVGRITSDGVSTFYVTTSDFRLKENRKPTQYSLKTLMQIEAEDYNYISDNNKSTRTGFIAQELFKIYPQAVVPGGDDPKTNPWMIDYSKLTPLLVKAVQEQQKIIEDQNKKIDKQQQQIDLLIKEMQSLKKDLITQKN